MQLNVFRHVQGDNSADVADPISFFDLPTQFISAALNPRRRGYAIAQFSCTLRLHGGLVGKGNALGLAAQRVRAFQ
jgi:hypothetical protein